MEVRSGCTKGYEAGMSSQAINLTVPLSFQPNPQSYSWQSFRPLHRL